MLCVIILSVFVQIVVIPSIVMQRGVNKSFFSAAIMIHIMLSVIMSNLVTLNVVAQKMNKNVFIKKTLLISNDGRKKY
jgi:hypothetical protein